MAPDYATYGINFYGSARYGRAPVSDLLLSTFTATPQGVNTPQGYSQVRVFWGPPTGTWDRVRLVRGRYGFPTDETDGSVLADLSNSQAPGSYAVIDTAVDQMQFYYYTLFLRLVADQSWIRAGNVVCLVPGNFGYTTQLYDLMPQTYRDGDAIYTISRGPDQGAGQLQTFLAVLGYACDTLRSELDSLLWVERPGRVSGGLLPLLAKQFGAPYEAELGMAQNRKMLRNIVHLYRTKGTKAGVEGAAYAFSGWAAIATPEANMMLSNDDASFEVGTGHWSEAVNVALGRQTVQGLLANSGPGTLIMTALAAGSTMEARLPATPDMSLPLLVNTIWPSFGGPPSLPLLMSASAPVQYLPSFYGAVLPDAVLNQTGASLPLLLGNEGGQPFTFSAYFQPVTMARNVFVRLFFYDINNVIVGETDGPQVTEVLNTPVRASATATAPSNARYAGFGLVVLGSGATTPTTPGTQAALPMLLNQAPAPVVTGIGTTATLPLLLSQTNAVIPANEQHMVDALQFEAGQPSAGLPLLFNQGPPTPWQPANGVKLVILADRVNRCDNPSFEASTANWNAVGCVLTRTSGISDVAGNWSGVVTTTAGVTRAGIQMVNRIPCTPFVSMAFSAYWQAATVPRPLMSVVDWYDQGGQKISSIGSGPVMSFPLLLNELPLLTDDVVWVRAPLIAIPPANAVSCLYSTYVVPVSGTLPGGEIHYVDCILIEASTKVGTYFDSSMGTPTADYRWEGPADLSRSHYYHRRSVRQSRLATRLPDFIPAGSTLRILTAQPL